MAKLMESVEDIAAEAILDGLPWDWTSYGGYLDSIQAMKPAQYCGIGWALIHSI